MKTNKKPFSISSVCGLKSRIDPEPDYQRPAVWSMKQKQLLIDTILRNFDIPKMYWLEAERNNREEYDVVDGQQRLRTIWAFQNNEFALAKNSDPVRGEDISSKKYDDLGVDMRMDFDNYSLDIVIITDAIVNDTEDEVRDMFLRLQNGTTLKAQEKRNARVGAMRDFVKSLAEHTFFDKCGFTNSRFTFDHVAAQTVLLELTGGPTNVRDSNLNRMYEENERFDPNGITAKKIRKVYGLLSKSFDGKAPELKRFNVINLYALTSLLIDKYVDDDLHIKIKDWFIGFEQERRLDQLKLDDEKDPRLNEYLRQTSYSTDGEDSINGRLDFIKERFFSTYPKLMLKDERRGFTEEQRLAIFRRDNSTCQIKLKCGGVQIKWGDWHADHIIPHTKGGQTTVENGQVGCVPCNLSKSVSIL